MIEKPEIDNEFRIAKIDPLYRELFEAALPFLDTRKNEIHTYIVYQYACVLLKREDAMAEIVLPACILHDVGWSAIPETDQLKGFGFKNRDESIRRKHEVEGVLIAKKILNTLRYGEDRTGRILSIIDGHDTTEAARSAEDAVVKDSDKLWRYSEVGFRTDVERFEISPSNHIAYLSKAIEKWFLIRESRNIASLECSSRKPSYNL